MFRCLKLCSHWTMFSDSNDRMELHNKQHHILLTNYHIINEFIYEINTYDGNIYLCNLDESSFIMWKCKQTQKLICMQCPRCPKSYIAGL